MEFKVVFMFLTAVVIVVARYPENSEIRLRNYLFNHPNYSSEARPVLNHHNTVNVTMDMILYAMIRLNEKDEVLTTASWINLHWEDERLSWNPAEFDDLFTLIIKVTDIWTPGIALLNSLDADALRSVSFGHGSIILTSLGDAYFGFPLVVSTSCPLRIKYFPFDTHICLFNFAPEAPRLNLMELTMENASEFSSHITSLEWDLLKTEVHNYKTPYLNSQFSVFLQRDPRYYIYSIIIPSTVMCLLALATFIAPPDSGERISLGVSMVLGLTVFQLLIADTLPTSSKQSPILSNYLSVNFLTSCLVVPCSLLNMGISYRERRLGILKYRWIRILIRECLPRCMGLAIKKTKKKNKVNSLTEDPLPNKDEPNGQNTLHHDSVPSLEDRSEKNKQENREVALLLDRLVLGGFLIFFTICIFKTVLEFWGNPGAQF